MTLRWSFLMSAVLLAGCAATDQQAQRAPQACCSSLSQATPLQLARATSMEATIDQNSPTFDFKEGKSHFTSFRLPSDQRPTRLLLKTHFLWSLAGTEMFCPAITFVDESMQPIASTGELKLLYDPPGWSKRGFWFTVVQIPPGASSVVVHTPEDTIGSVSTMAGPSGGGVTMVGKTPIYVANGGARNTPPCGREGRIEMEVR